MTESVRVYALPWHIDTSPAFRLMLAGLTGNGVHPRFLPWTGEGVPPEFDEAVLCGDPMVFCQIPPPLSVPAALGRSTWIPMWDHACGLSRAWWRNLPGSLQVLCLSDAVGRLLPASRGGTLKLRFFPEVPPASQTSPGTAFYWNRRGLYPLDVLACLCRALQVEALTVLDIPDPGCGASALGPDVLAVAPSVTRITEGLLVPDAFQALLDRTQIVFAPRLLEGVGLSFLEAMARGSAVVAPDSPTMSEYIHSGRNGILLRVQGGASLAYRRIRARVTRKPRTAEIHAAQDWQSIETADVDQLGRRAREDVIVGRENWDAAAEDLVAFVLR